MIADPPVRDDGLCHVCLKRRGVIPKTLVKRTAADLRELLAADPFCSVECARRYHGTSLPALPAGPRKQKWAAVA